MFHGTPKNQLETRLILNYIFLNKYFILSIVYKINILVQFLYLSYSDRLTVSTNQRKAVEPIGNQNL